MAETQGIFFNVQHAPIGAFASFTLGCKGATGGLGLELRRPADESVFIGVESRRGGRFEALPFFAGAEDERRRYDVAGGGAPRAGARLRPFRDARIWRTLGLTFDRWEAGDLTFTIHTPFRSAPDPEAAPPEELQRAYVPAVLAELTIDNRAGRRARTGFFGYAGRDPCQKMRRLDDTAHGHFTGVGVGTRTAIVSDDPAVRSGLGFDADLILRPGQPENLAFALGDTGLLLADVPAGKRATFRFAICFYHGGTVTTGLPASYLYTRWFDSIEDVATFATRHFETLRSASDAPARAFRSRRLSDDQRFHLVHAVHSYYASTELLDAGRPLWVVNEGEYRMMNTFDLTVDQVFLECLLNPWTVRNELDWYAARYRYTDSVRFPGDATEHPGGVSFTHDMGVANNLSRPGHSAYELFGREGCFSHMTHEELVNWVCCALVYIARSGDMHWFTSQAPLLKACFESLCRRDHPDPACRTGVMKLDSSRCRGASEITTYDSLDASLGQARGNLYLAVKTWAAYACLGERFEGVDDPAAAAMRAQAARAARTIVSAADAEGRLPALLEAGVTSRILPAVEGLVFPWFCGHRRLVSARGPYAALIAALRRHLAASLKPGCCLFADGGWKLSSTSDNAWLSKIYLCQFVARRILGLPGGAAGRRADAAHAAWLLRPDNAYWAWSDQMVAGVAKGSKYYPRGVTSVLWTLE